MGRSHRLPRHQCCRIIFYEYVRWFPLPDNFSQPLQPLQSTVLVLDIQHRQFIRGWGTLRRIPPLTPNEQSARHDKMQPHPMLFRKFAIDRTIHRLMTRRRSDQQSDFAQKRSRGNVTGCPALSISIFNSVFRFTPVATSRIPLETTISNSAPLWPNITLCS